MNIETYQTTSGWGYNVNARLGGGAGASYPFRWMAWLAAYFTGRRYQ